MEMILISFYIAKNFNQFKSFLILVEGEQVFHFVSTYNNRITVVRTIPVFENTFETDEDFYKEIAIKLGYAPEGYFSPDVRRFFEANHKSMIKRANIEWSI